MQVVGQPEVRAMSALQTGNVEVMRGREEGGGGERYCCYIICGALEIGFVTLITINK